MTDKEEFVKKEEKEEEEVNFDITKKKKKKKKKVRIEDDSGECFPFGSVVHCVVCGVCLFF